MRQIIELVSSLINRNPKKEASLALKTAIVRRTLSIITHQAAQPLVKPAFKSLEYLVGKGTIPVDLLIQTYQSEIRHGMSVAALETSSNEYVSWNNFFSETFEWMTYPDISPATGKFLVTLFLALKTQPAKFDSYSKQHSASWQRWISSGLSNNPEVLENVKNYLFAPLFKLDRAGSIVFLEDLSLKAPTWEVHTEDADAHALLRLSAMEIGKKSGLIEESGM